MINHRLQIITIIILLSGLLAFQSCKKENNTVNPSSSDKVSYISGIGNLTYNMGHLQTYGNYRLLFNGNELTGIREKRVDTVYSLNNTDTTISHYLLRYSYLHQNEVVRKVIIDTLLNKSASFNNFGSPSVFKGSPFIGTEYTHLKHAIYYYAKNRLDSVIYFPPSTTNNNVYKIIYHYNAAGNIAKQTIYTFPQGSLLSPTYQQGEIITTTFTYDQNLNPWHLLFKQTGVLLPGMIDRNISKNNPVSASSLIIIGKNKFPLNVTYKYQYNKEHYPTKIIISGKDTTVFKYL